MANGILQYGELAKYYDLLYQWKDYKKEAGVVKELVERYKTSQGNSLLDVGCGTAKHLQYLTDKFDCVGVDASEKMLEQARRNMRGGKFVLGDMINFDLGRQFDVILCLFSSIGYVRTYSRLGMTLKNFARHLKTGGGNHHRALAHKVHNQGGVCPRTCPGDERPEGCEGGLHRRQGGHDGP